MNVIAEMNDQFDVFFCHVLVSRPQPLGPLPAGGEGKAQFLRRRPERGRSPKPTCWALVPRSVKAVPILPTGFETTHLRMNGVRQGWGVHAPPLVHYLAEALVLGNLPLNLYVHRRHRSRVNRLGSQASPKYNPVGVRLAGCDS